MRDVLRLSLLQWVVSSGDQRVSSQTQPMAWPPGKSKGLLGLGKPGGRPCCPLGLGDQSGSGRPLPGVPASPCCPSCLSPFTSGPWHLPPELCPGSPRGCYALPRLPGTVPAAQHTVVTSQPHLHQAGPFLPRITFPTALFSPK